MTPLETFPSKMPGRHYEEINLAPAGEEPSGIIGEGGESLVYLVRAIEEGEEVGRFALKQCTERKQRKSGSGWKILDRFKQQAEFMKQLDHLNIVDMVELVDTNGRYVEPHLVMEYVEGQDLSKRLKQGQVTPMETDSIISQVIQAVKHAHAQTNGGGAPAPILHRDLKPAQIMIQPDGLVKLLDFGAGKQLSDTTQYTAVSTGGATYDYAAPEHFGFFKHSEATDVYGLGLLLYEMVTGKPMPRGNDHKHTIPEEYQKIRWHQIIQQATQWDPADRCTLDDFTTVITLWADYDTIRPTRQPKSRTMEKEHLLYEYTDLPPGFDVPKALAGRTGKRIMDDPDPTVIEGVTHPIGSFTLPEALTKRKQLALAPVEDENAFMEQHKYLFGGVPEKYQASWFNKIGNIVVGGGGLVSGLAGGAFLGAGLGASVLGGNPGTAVIGLVVGGALGLVCGGAAGSYVGFSIADLPYKILQKTHPKKDTKALANPDESYREIGLLEGLVGGTPLYDDKIFYGKKRAFRKDHDTALTPVYEDIGEKLDEIENEYGPKKRRILAHNFAHKMLEEEKYGEVVKVAEHVLKYVVQPEGAYVGKLKRRHRRKKEKELLENICLGLLRKGAVKELAELRRKRVEYISGTHRIVWKKGSSKAKTLSNDNGLEIVLGNKKVAAIDAAARDVLRSGHHDLYEIKRYDEDVTDYVAQCKTFGLVPNLEKCERALVPAPIEEARELSVYRNKYLEPEFSSMERLGIQGYLQEANAIHGVKGRQKLARAYAAEKLRTGEYDKVAEVVEYSITRPQRETKGTGSRAEGMYKEKVRGEEAPLIQELMYGLLNKGAWEELGEVRRRHFPEDIVDETVKQCLTEIQAHLKDASREELSAYQNVCKAFQYAAGVQAAGNEISNRILERHEATFLE